MEMDPQEREDEMGDDSPISHNDEEISDPDGESGRESSDELRRQTVGNMVTDHHEDLIAKLKMQVRDIKDDFENASRHLNFTLPRGAMPDNFHLPSPFSFTHPGAPMMQPLLQPTKPSSGSSNSSDGSNTWSFEEQFKQNYSYEGVLAATQSKLVKALYDISDDPKRKEFLDELFSFMHKRGTPINRLPIMAKSVLDLYQLYNLVVQRGGLVEVINKKLWQEIIKGLQLPSSITSAAFTLRTQYMKYLYPFEVEQHHLSTEADLQAAIDGNRREGRRSNYAQYDTVQRSPSIAQQISPLSLMSQQQQLARMNSVMSGGLALHNGGHHAAHPHQPLGQPVNGGALAAFAHGDMEARMLEYVKMFKDLRVPNPTSPRQENISPPVAAPSPFNQLELSRTLWSVYNNNQPQKEALNLADANTQSAIKREPETRESPPPSKKIYKEEERKPVVSPTTHIKISNRGDGRNGESSLFVSMEINGITYEGVLCALTAPSNGRSSLSP